MKFVPSTSEQIDEYLKHHKHEISVPVPWTKLHGWDDACDDKGYLKGYSDEVEVKKNKKSNTVKLPSGKLF